jgi:hypothetical protein
MVEGRRAALGVPRPVRPHSPDTPPSLVDPPNVVAGASGQRGSTPRCNGAQATAARGSPRRAVSQAGADRSVFGSGVAGLPSSLTGRRTHVQTKQLQRPATRGRGRRDQLVCPSEGGRPVLVREPDLAMGFIVEARSKGGRNRRGALRFGVPARDRDRGTRCSRGRPPSSPGQRLASG